MDIVNKKTQQNSFFAGKKKNSLVFVTLDLNAQDTILSHEVVSGSDIMPCNKMDKRLVVYRFCFVT